MPREKLSPKEPNPPYWLIPPPKMDSQIWIEYLSNCGIGEMDGCFGRIVEKSKLDFGTFERSYSRLLDKNSSKKRQSYYSTSSSKIELLRESMPHNFLARIVNCLYGSPLYPPRSEIYSLAKKLGLNTGWQPTFILFYFRKLYSQDKKMDWDFFAKSLFVFAIKSEMLLSPYMTVGNRKKLRKGLKNITTDRNSLKRHGYVIDEKSFLKDFGDLLFLTSNIKIQKDRKSTGAKEYGKKERIQKKRLSSMLTKFDRKMRLKKVKLRMPRYLIAESEFFSI